MSLLGWVAMGAAVFYIGTHLGEVAAAVGAGAAAAWRWVSGWVGEAVAPLPPGARWAAYVVLVTAPIALLSHAWWWAWCGAGAEMNGAAWVASCRAAPWPLVVQLQTRTVLGAVAHTWGLLLLGGLYGAYRLHLRAAGVRWRGRWGFLEFTFREAPQLALAWARRVVLRGGALEARGAEVAGRLRSRGEEAAARRAEDETRRWAAAAARRLVDAIAAAGGAAWRDVPRREMTPAAAVPALAVQVVRRLTERTREPLLLVTPEVVGPGEARFTVQYLAAPTPATLAAWRTVVRETAAPTLGVDPSQVHAEGSLGLRVSLSGSRGAAPSDGDGDDEEEDAPPAVDLAAPLVEGCPPLTLLPAPTRGVGRPNEGRTVAGRVVSALGALDVPGTEVVGCDVGPAAIAVTIRPPRGVRGSLVLRLQTDLSIELASPALRLAASPNTPGCVLIEVPRDHPAPVALRSVVGTSECRGAAGALPVAFGVDTAGGAVVADLASLPHLLAAGATGSGKTVALHSLITSLVLRLPPTALRLALVDPKWTEFSAYDGLSHLLCPCITEIPATVALLTWLSSEMDRRYRLLSGAGVVDLAGYNRTASRSLPRIVVVADEIADTMLAGKKDQREEVQRQLARLLAKARAAGIHCVLATQRPVVDVLPGLVKANAPARLALAVQSSLDSRIILDQDGAEALGGRGDALLALPGARAPVRVQCPWVERGTVESVVRWWARQAPVKYDPSLVAALAAAGMEVPVEATPMAPVMAPSSPGAVDAGHSPDDAGWRP